MTFALRQALEILQMPQMELAQWLRQEIERNPLLELDSTEGIPAKGYQPEIASPVHLYDHLIAQVRENFSSPLQRMMAEEILEHLDEKGFMTGSLSEIALFFQKPLSEIESIFTILQTFDPPGICARNLQESLLLQLKAQNLAQSSAYILIRDCFEDLLQGRYSSMKKKLGPEELTSAIHKLARLHFRPADLFRQEVVPTAVPDIHISKVEEGWILQILDDELPKFHIQSQYLSLHPESSEEREALRTYSTSAKWLCRSLNRRRKLLLEIGSLLIRKQAKYLDQKGSLVSFTLKELSEELQIHESTLSRALSGKYAATPRGLVPLRSLIASSPTLDPGKQALQKMIAAEDKQNPLTDDQLSINLKAVGLTVARRTVAKYRRQLKISSASHRKHLSKKLSR